MNDNIVRFPARPIPVRHLQQLLRDSRAANDPAPAPWPTEGDGDAPVVAFFRQRQRGFALAMLLAAAFAFVAFAAPLISGAAQ